VCLLRVRGLLAHLRGLHGAVLFWGGTTSLCGRCVAALHPAVLHACSTRSTHGYVLVGAGVDALCHAPLVAESESEESGEDSEESDYSYGKAVRVSLHTARKQIMVTRVFQSIELG